MTDLAGAIPRLGEFIPTMQPSYATVDELMDAHDGRTWAEIKHDGYRIQVHRGRRLLKMFTRNGNELNYQCYPDLVEIASRLPTCIIDAEMVAEGNSHKDVFDRVKRRFRKQGIKQETIDKYLASGIVDDIPLHLSIFDTLRFERKGLLHLPFDERMSYTEAFGAPDILPVDGEMVWGSEDLESLISDVTGRGEEGLVCKNPDSPYLPGSDRIDWVKFKRSETLDLVIVGFYQNGNYVRELPFTSVLVAAYNEDAAVYETMGKIGVTRDALALDIHDQVRECTTEARPDKVVFSEKLDRPSYSMHVPDFYIDPEQSVVLEVKAMNLNFNRNWQTCGRKGDRAFSMRIGYASQLRPDKTPRQSTTTDIVRKLYEIQEGI